MGSVSIFPLSDVLGMEGGGGSWLVGIAGAVDGPGEWGVMGSVHICLLPDLLCVEGGRGGSQLLVEVLRAFDWPGEFVCVCMCV